MRIYGHITLVEPSKVNDIGAPVTTLCGRRSHIGKKPAFVYCRRCVKASLDYDREQATKTHWKWVSIKLTREDQP